MPIKKLWREKHPHDLTTIVATMAFRRAIRSFLQSSAYVVAVKIPRWDDLEIFEQAAFQLLDPEFQIDIDGRRSLLVDEASDISETGWRLAYKFRDIHRAILFYAQEVEISAELNLMIDRRVTLEAPSSDHFCFAARKIGISITDQDAEYLATRSLRDIRLAARPQRPIDRMVRILRNSSLVEPVSSSKSVEHHGNLLENMAGYGDAKDWGLQLAEDIKAWMRDELEWKDVDRGVLLLGAPGTGKTTYAQALANTCGITLICESAASWQAEGHLGDMLKAMRKAFERAQASRPAILFLDEFDSFGNRNTLGDKSHADYARQVINALLECLDPASGREGVVVLAATNNAGAIDPALLRPGRLERVIEISLPDAEARKAILSFHLGQTPAGKLLEFVKNSYGWSGADIEKLARDARRAVRKAGGSLVTENDLISAMPSMVPFTDEQRFRLAVHEAGHAVLGHILRPGSLVKVSICSGRPIGATWRQIGTTEFSYSLPLFATAGDFEKNITIFLGGMAAERIVFGEHSTSAGGDDTADLCLATDAATLMERSFGFGDGLVTDLGAGSRPLEGLRQFDKALQESVRRRLDILFKRATEMLESKRSEVDKLATQLAERLELSAEEVRSICEPGLERADNRGRVAS